MNPFDKDNLDFFINSPMWEFNLWAEQASDDELVYAMNLVRQARVEKDIELAECFDNIDSTDQAKQILKQFTLGK